LDEGGRPGQLHRMPAGPVAVRWQLLFSSPFFHPTVLLDRELLERNDLRYDPAFAESEDYDLWARLLDHTEGDNLAEPLVLKPVPPGQASRRRGEVQRSFQRQVAQRERAKLGIRDDPPLTELLNRFDEQRGLDREVRDAAARRLARAGHVAQALRLSPTAFGRAAARRVGASRGVQRQATSWLPALADQPAAPL